MISWLLSSRSSPCRTGGYPFRAAAVPLSGDHCERYVFDRVLANRVPEKPD